MKRILCAFTGALLFTGAFVYADTLSLESTGTTGDSVRKVQTIVNYNESAAKKDLMPLYICKNKIPALAVNEEVKFYIKDTTDWRGWASFDGSNDANTLKFWIDNGYTFTAPASLPCATPPELVNAEFKPGTKTAGLHHMQARIDTGDINIKTVLIPVIEETEADVGTNPHVTITNFAVFELVSTTSSGSNKYATLKFIRMATLADVPPAKKVDFNGAVEVQR